MEECDMLENHIHRLYFVKCPVSPAKLQKKEFEKQYRLIIRERNSISEELAQQKEDEFQMNRKLMRFSLLDKIKEWTMSEIKHIEYWDQVGGGTRGKFKGTGSSFQQVQQEHLSLSKSCEIQELNDRIESMVQRIQHGNNKRADEMKMYQEIHKFKEAKETIIALEPDSIRQDDVEYIKRQRIGLRARISRLKAELEHLRGNISYLNMKLEDVDSKTLEAYKRAYPPRDQKKELNSSYNEYQYFKTYAKKLARKGDVSGLKYVCDTQLEGFMRQWNDSKAFREDYEKRKLAWPIT